MFNVESLKVGDIVRLPVYPESTVLQGTVIYIKPGKFYRVEFVTESGNTLRESYPFHGPITPRNEKISGEVVSNG